MRSSSLPAILLALAFSATACQLVWSYDDLESPQGAGGSVAADAGSNAAGAANGLACVAGTDCRSGNCEPGAAGGTVCCAASCGTCQTCDDDGGACVPIPAGTPGPGCTGSMSCDGAGGCGVPPGGACPDGDIAVCSNGTCIDGICCATPCPACQTCTPDGLACADLPWWSTDTRCMTSLMTCDGAGKCV